uniref:Integrase catalytic domain-containing protein n=1 Tax=Amphimedon queenslandica TaxID=400682 RepID=A0A1X7U6W1_AMPQE
MHTPSQGDAPCKDQSKGFIHKYETGADQGPKDEADDNIFDRGYVTRRQERSQTNCDSVKRLYLLMSYSTISRREELEGGLQYPVIYITIFYKNTIGEIILDILLVENCMGWNCSDCAVVSGSGRKQVPPIQPIPVQRPLQIFGVDIMELPVTQRGNRYVIVFQDFLTKWPMVFPAPAQKANRIARLVAEEILPLFGVPECLLSDRGTNLLANVMKELCTFLGIQKLITTAYHPQCNGMIEKLNSTLKSMLRRHAAKFGPQWDQYLPGVQWAYQNTPHEATKEKPSFLMFGVDLRSPTEAASLPLSQSRDAI